MTPRILSIAFLAFLALFSLDVFGEDYSFWKTILAFFIHNIPVFILLIVLLISWKHEIVGGLSYILAGLLYIFFALSINSDKFWMALAWSFIIAGPAFIIGGFFLANWINMKKYH